MWLNSCSLNGSIPLSVLNLKGFSYISQILSEIQDFAVSSNFRRCSGMLLPINREFFFLLVLPVISKKGSHCVLPAVWLNTICSNH